MHTGLGKYREDTLLVEPKDCGTFRPMFGERVALFEPEQSPAYRVRGGIQSMIPRALPAARVYFLTQEFGTYSGIKVLRALR